MENIMKQILDRLDSMDEKIGTLKSDMGILKSDMAVLKSDMRKFERKQEAIFEQTGLLLEFKTEITEKLNKIISDNLSLQHIVGEREIAIRSMRRSL